MFSRDEEEIIYKLAEQLTGSTQKGSSRKTVLVQNVARRVQTVGSKSLAAYLDYAARHRGEYAQLISALTIHFTSWFREAEHFELVFREAMVTHDAGEILRVLCAACSTGEEVYSLALFLEAKRQSHLIRDYEIFGTDIDGVSVATAEKAIYPAARIAEIPLMYRPYLLTGSGKTEGLFTLDREIRQRTHFKQGDLRVLPAPGADGQLKPYTAILCRNVLIYFDAKGVQAVVKTLVQQLRPGGILCLGHSETVDAAAFKLEAKGRSLYKRPFSAEQSGDGPNMARVLVVDDSAVIRKVMVSLLTRAGFATESVDSAASATRTLKEKTFDLITLDLNMPEQDGASWLRMQRSTGMRIPVVIVSDAAVSAAEEVLGALTSGAQDYIEKRELNESPQKLGDRLKAIAGQHIKNRSQPRSKGAQVKKGEWKKTRPDLILVGASTGGTEALIELLRMMPLNCPPVLVVQHITPAFSLAYAQRLAQAAGLKLGKSTQDTPLETGHLYMAQGDYHIGVKKGGITGWRLDLSYGPAEHSVRPAIDYLFRSGVQTKGKSIAVLLTGMGKDGALGLRDLKNSGCLTMAQDESSCVVYGMPREAADLDAVQLIGDLKTLRQEIDQCLSGTQAAA